MKKDILITFIGLFLSINAQAQIKKGAFIIGGDVTYRSYHILDDSNHLSTLKPYSFNFSPEIGYFINKNVAVGAKISVDLSNRVWVINSSSSNYSDISSKNTDVSFMPFIRYYFNPNSPLKFFYQLNALGKIYNSREIRNQVINNAFRSVAANPRIIRILQIDNSIGFDYFITGNIAVESSINYVYYYTQRVNDNSQSPFTAFLPKPVFNPEIKMKLFLNADKTNNKVLAEKYLKKGNTTYGLTGKLDFSDLYFNVSPSAGYFLTNKLLIGSFLDISFYNNFNFSVGISPEMRFYQPINKNVQILLRGSTTTMGLSFDLSDKKTGTRF
jgi:hypothetical protein